MKLVVHVHTECFLHSNINFNLSKFYLYATGNNLISFLTIFRSGVSDGYASFIL